MKEILTNPNFLIAFSVCFIAFIIFIAIIGYQVFRPFSGSFQVTPGRPQSFRYLLTQISVLIILVMVLIILFILLGKNLLDGCNTSTLLTLTITLAFGTVTAIGLKKQGDN